MDRIEERAPAVYVSDCRYPRIIELSTAEWSANRIVHTSIGSRVFLEAMVHGRASGACKTPLGGTMHVWPDATWTAEAALFFVTRLCDDGLCDREAAAQLLRPHGLWNDPFSVTDWRDQMGRSAGGLRAWLNGAKLAPRYQVLFRNDTAVGLNEFVHAEHAIAV